MTPYELRFEIFKTALSIAEGEALFQKDMKDRMIEAGVDEKHLLYYVKEYPQFPTVKRITEIAKQINNFVSEQS